MAEDFGRRLLADVEVVGFDQLLVKIRADGSEPRSWFNCAQIDGILRTLQRCNAPADICQPPLLEITSIAPQGGKTHLLYLLTSIAVTEVQHGGLGACVAILDADASFDVHRLMQQIRLRLQSRISDIPEDGLDALIRASLDHVYILKPQDASALISTVSGLPNWFLHQKHKSLSRAMAFFAIDSINALNFPASSAGGVHSGVRDTAGGYSELMVAVRTSSKVLQCPAVLATRYQGALPASTNNAMPRSIRPDVATASRPDLRLIVRRVPVRNIPSGLSAEEAAREAAERMKIVALGRFECIVNEYGLDQRTIQALYAAEDGFFFRIKADGLTMDAESET